MSVAELALTKPDPELSEDSLRVMMAAAKRYVESGLLPGEVNTPQKALVIMAAGREMGVPATYALRNIHVVKGKPVCSAELLLALVRRTYGPGAIRVAKTDATACTVQYREQGWDGVSEFTFSIEDAKTAGLLGNPTWKNYPAAMLRARAISACVRFAFPECIAGLYTPEELGADVDVVDGEVVVTGTTGAALRVVDAEPTEQDVERAEAMVTLSPRQQQEREYKRLATNAVTLGHPKAEKIAAIDGTTLTDGVLAASIKSLDEWIAKQDSEAF